MNRDIMTQLEALKQRIEHTDISQDVESIEEWGGADVIIKSHLDSDIEKWLGNQPLVISYQSSEPRRRAVITKFYKELSWLFYQLRDIFSGNIDYITKYDFYGLLAQSAIDYITLHGELQDAKPLLLTVLNSSKGFCDNESSQ